MSNNIMFFITRLGEVHKSKVKGEGHEKIAERVLDEDKQLKEEYEEVKKIKPDLDKANFLYFFKGWDRGWWNEEYYDFISFPPSTMGITPKQLTTKRNLENDYKNKMKNKGISPEKTTLSR